MVPQIRGHCGGSHKFLATVIAPMHKTWPLWLVPQTPGYGDGSHRSVATVVGPRHPWSMWWVPQISGHVRAAITTQRLAVTTSHLGSHRSSCKVELQLGASHVDCRVPEARCAVDEGDSDLLRSGHHRTRRIRQDFFHCPSPSTRGSSVVASRHHNWTAVLNYLTSSRLDHDRTAVLDCLT